MTTENQTTNQ